MELARDLRRHWFPTTVKSTLLGVFFLSVYILVSFSESTTDAVNRSFSSEAEVNLYSIIDTLEDPDAFSSFRESRQAVENLGAFYTAVDTLDDIDYLSSFAQPIPVLDFAGDETFDAGSGTYTDPGTGLQVRDVKSIQMNRSTFDFYHLGQESGQPIAWESVDYDSGRAPVLLGASYSGVYSVGDTLPVNFYSRPLTLEVAGFLEPASSMFYKNEMNFFLDDYILVPYPPQIGDFTDEDHFFSGILYFAMLNGDITAHKDMSTDDLLDELLSVSRRTGFSDYSLIDVPTYLTQFTLVRTIVEDNLALLVTIEIMLGASVVGSVVAINVYLARRRRRRDHVRWQLGHSTSALSRSLAASWGVETLLVVAVFATGIALFPTTTPTAVSTTLALLAVSAAADVLHQRSLLARRLHSPERKKT